MRKERFEEIRKFLGSKVSLLDGAMGTMIQRLNLTEEDYRGEEFRNHDFELKGCHDILVLTCQDAIADIHRQYIDAGADIITTDSFNANAISLADYGLVEEVERINAAAASIARKAADEEMSRMKGRRILVAGTMGPTNRSASLSPDVENPGKRNVTFDHLADAFHQQAKALISGGTDILLIETVYDTINMKAALEGARRAMREIDTMVPVMVSFTISDRGGHILSGQTIEALMTSLGDAPEVMITGLNCSFGPKDILPHLRHLSAISPYLVSCHPNAGHPDELGEYRQTPEIFAATLSPALNEGMVNIIGGCCGTTPEHIRRLKKSISGRKLREAPQYPAGLRISGLDMLDTSACDFTVVGERCNVAGSRKFLRLIKEKKYDEALAIAARQIEDGAMVIDINMDDALLDARSEMVEFLNLAGADPDIAKVPFMIDSSDWDVVENALKSVQGKCIVNSISLKEGEGEFLRKATRIRELGAAVVVMAFDEEGQADTFSRKKDICARAYRLLTEEAGMNPYDIIFDPNIMAVATGVEQHNLYARDFIRATGWIRRNLPGVSVSGGVSNLSFAFRGHNRLREAMHAVFLYHARKEGMNMAIVNPATMMAYEEVEPELRTLLDDVILASRPDAPEELARWAMKLTEEKEQRKEDSFSNTPSSEKGDLNTRLREAVIKGNSENLEKDLTEALNSGMKAVDIIEGPLMQGMEHVGELFGEGRMFLPQVVKTARTMRNAVEILRPSMEKGRSEGEGTKRGRVLFATVKGDVHDIGKNIVSIVLECNNYEVIDLGVMVPAETIVEKALELHPDIISLSGLITPSLAEMAKVARALERAGLRIPLVVGGAATSAVHTALRIAPEYSAPVIHARDAAQNPLIAEALLNEKRRDEFISALKKEQQEMRDKATTDTAPLSPDMARKRKVEIDWEEWQPIVPVAGIDRDIRVHIPLEEIIPLINWRYFFHAWKVTGRFIESFPYEDPDLENWIGTLPDDEREKAGEALALYRDAVGILSDIEEKNPGIYGAEGIVRFATANSGNEYIEGEGWMIPTPRRLKPDTDGSSPALSDFIMPAESGRKDFIGFFAVTAVEPSAEPTHEEGCSCPGCRDEYGRLLRSTLRDRIAEAASEWLHREVRRALWGYSEGEDLPLEDIRKGNYPGIRPAIGYPSLPDQLLTHELGKLLPLSRIGVSLTENGALSPASSVCGLYIAHPRSRYFSV